MLGYGSKFPENRMKKRNEFVVRGIRNVRGPAAARSPYSDFRYRTVGFRCFLVAAAKNIRV